MTSFTAINASEAIQNPASDSRTVSDVPAHVRITRSSSEQPSSSTVVSQYLGRDDEDVPPLAGPPRGPASKKTGGKPEKRASILASRTNVKRRKISLVSDGMQISKPTRHSGTSGTLLREAEANAKGSEAIQPSKQKPKSSSQAAFAIGPQTTQYSSQPISVLVPPTSMEKLHGSSQQTSVDAIRTSWGHGATLYSGDQAPNYIQNATTSAKPWLKQTASSNQTYTTANTKLLRPGKGRANNTNPDIEDKFVNHDDDNLAKVSSLTDHAKTAAKVKHQNKICTYNKVLFPTPANSDGISQHSVTTRTSSQREHTFTAASDQDLIDLDDGDDAQLAGIAKAIEEEPTVRRSPTLPQRDRRRNIREVDENDHYEGSRFPYPENKPPGDLKSTTREDKKRPIIRKPFPMSILDRSPIFGASNGNILRTCFRIGEALNVGSQAVRENRHIALELYGRVKSSWRDPPQVGGHRKQHFVFHDLYHDNPPHLEGVFELWNQSRLWELDSKVFLTPREEGIMCRVVAKMKRERGKWRLEVLSLWEAAWEDVEFIAGIYAKGK